VRGWKADTVRAVVDVKDFKDWSAGVELEKSFNIGVWGWQGRCGKKRQVLCHWDMAL
jgi:hypothetical protein